MKKILETKKLILREFVMEDTLALQKMIAQAKYKNLFTYLFVSLTLLVAPACLERSNIHEVKNLILLEQVVPSLDENSLVIFDVDETLIEAENLWRSDVNKKAKSIWYPLYQKIHKTVSSRDKKRVLFSRMGMALKPMLIDKNVPQIINQIKKQDTKVLALTKFFPGKFGDMKNSEEHRFQELKKLGIDFSSSFPQYISFEMPELSDKKPAPVFHKGIVPTSHCTKGETLVGFLNKINWWPNRIIFIDDKIENLKEVAQIAKEKNIDFLGLHYRAAEDLPCTVDPEVAEFQINYLIKHEQWMGEEQAKEFMREEK